MDRALWADLLRLLRRCEQDEAVRGLVFQSGLERPVFTAGNDLSELYAPGTSRERYLEFWRVSTEFLAALYRTRLSTAAALPGYTPAGGCVLALCCDLRVAAAGGSMGLNEPQLGIPVPRRWAELMGRVAGQGAAEQLLLPGRMVPVQEALRLGLVQAVVPSREEVLPKALVLVREQLALPEGGRAATKALLRSDFGRAWEAGWQEEAEFGWEFLARPETVAALGRFMGRLGTGGGPKAKL